MTDVPEICAALKGLQRQRKAHIRAKNREGNASGAMVRTALGWTLELPEKEREAIEKRASKIVKDIFDGELSRVPDGLEDIASSVEVFRDAMAPHEKRIAIIEREMVRLARELPVYPFARSVVGFGDKALAVVIGETGDLNLYPHFRHVWKRLGLAPFEGRAGSTWKLTGGMPEGGWATLGYSPRRRAEIYSMVGDPMGRLQWEAAKKSGTEFGRATGRYGEIYVARRERTKVSHPAGTPAQCKIDPLRWTKAHSHMDGLRIMTKALISDLWSEWRGSGRKLSATMSVALSTSLAAEAA